MLLALIAVAFVPCAIAHAQGVRGLADDLSTLPLSARVTFARLALRTIGLLAWASTAGAQVRIDEVHVFAGPSLTHHAALVQASDGNFYGTATDGYATGRGAIYRLTPDGTFTVLHEFSGGADGAHPLAALIQATDGLLYGTTQQGGPADLGTIFRMTMDGRVTVLHAFTNADDGAQPYTGALTQGRDGAFYGTAVGNCTTSGCGSNIFQDDRVRQSDFPVHVPRERRFGN